MFYFFNPVYNIIKGVLFVGNEFKDTPLLPPPPPPCSMSATYFKRSTEHIYIGHYLYSFHAHGTQFSSLSVRTIIYLGSHTLVINHVAAKPDIYSNIPANRTRAYDAPVASYYITWLVYTYNNKHHGPLYQPCT